MATTVTETIGTNSRDYSTISGWESATDNDLVSADEIRVGECYNDSAFSEEVTFSGASTGSSNYRRLTVAEGHRHGGVPGAGVVVKDPNVNAFGLIRIAENYMGVLWLEMDGSTGDASAGFQGGGELGSFFGQCMAHDCDTYGFRGTTGEGFHGCISFEHGFHGFSANDAGQFYNCLAYNNPNNGFTESFSVGTAIYKNCASFDNATDFDYDSGGSHDNRNCASSDATADDEGGSGHLINQTATDWFESLTAGSEDFHLKAGANGIDAGTDLGDVPAKIDIDGGDRHAAGVTWDIGADEDGLGESTPVSNTSQGHFEALQVLAPASVSAWESLLSGVVQTSEGSYEASQGVAETSVGLHESKGVLRKASEGLQEARGLLAVASQGAWEAVRGGIAQSAESVYEALAQRVVPSAGIHESTGTLSVSSSGLLEAVSTPVLDLASFLFYWSAENNKRPVVGGDPLYTRDTVRWYLDPNTEKYRRVPAHYSPVSEERSHSGYDVPILHLERAGIAENQDTNRFDSGSAWAGQSGFASVAPVGAAFEGEHGYLFRDPSGSFANVRQDVGTISGSTETLSVIFEVLQKPSGGEVTIAIRDVDAANHYARIDVDVTDDSVNVVNGTGGEIVRKWSRKGPNGGDVYRVAARGSGTANNQRRLYIYPGGAGTGETGARIVLHHAQLEEQAWASSPIVSEAAGATRATTDLFYVGGAPTTDSKIIVYGRVWKDFNEDGPGSTPALITIGDPEGVRLVVYWTTDVGFQLVNSSTNVTKTLSPAGDVSDEVEFYWVLEPDWSGRVGLRVEGGTPSGADHDPIAPEDWGENRIYFNRRVSAEKGAARFESLKVALAGDVQAALDGTEDADLFDELREHRLDRRGSLYVLS